MNHPIKIMIVDDHPIVREGLRRLLELESDLKVVAEASNGLQCLRLMEKEVPDLVLMDIEMPGIGGLEATRLICEKYPRLKVIILTIHKDDESVRRAIAAGACGYILKNVKRQEITRIIRQVMGDKSFLDPTLTASIFKQIKQGTVKPSAAEEIKLTQRELEVLQGLVSGQTYLQLADNLCISEHTVRSHIKSLYRKLGVNSRALAMSKAISIGIIASPINIISPSCPQPNRESSEP